MRSHFTVIKLCLCIQSVVQSTMLSGGASRLEQPTYLFNSVRLVSFLDMTNFFIILKDHVIKKNFEKGM